MSFNLGLSKSTTPSKALQQDSTTSFPLFLVDSFPLKIVRSKVPTSLTSSMNPAATSFTQQDQQQPSTSQDSRHEGFSSSFTAPPPTTALSFPGGCATDQTNTITNTNTNNNNLGNPVELDPAQVKTLSGSMAALLLNNPHFLNARIIDPTRENGNGEGHNGEEENKDESASALNDQNAKGDHDDDDDAMFMMCRQDSTGHGASVCCKNDFLAAGHEQQQQQQHQHQIAAAAGGGEGGRGGIEPQVSAQQEIAPEDDGGSGFGTTSFFRSGGSGGSSGGSGGDGCCGAFALSDSFVQSNLGLNHMQNCSSNNRNTSGAGSEEQESETDIIDNITAMSLLACSEDLMHAPIAAADKTGRITLFSVAPRLRSNDNRGKLSYRVLSFVNSSVCTSDADDATDDVDARSTTTSSGGLKTPTNNKEVQSKPKNSTLLCSPTAAATTTTSTATTITASSGLIKKSVAAAHQRESGLSKIRTVVENSEQHQRRQEQQQQQQDPDEFKGRLTHQAFSVDQDRGSYPQRKPVDEKVTAIAPVGAQQHQLSPHSLLYLASNDMLIKLYRLRSYRNAVLDENSQPFTNAASSSPGLTNESNVILPIRTFVSSHTTPICALSTCADQETFLSADCFKVQWWHLENPDPAHPGVTLYDMQPKGGEDVTEVLTNAAFHPSHTSLFLVTSSSGSCRIGDLRDPPSAQRRFHLNFHSTATALSGGASSGWSADFTSRWTSDALIARALKCLHGAVFLGANTPYVVTRDYMSVALWDMRKASPSAVAPSPLASSSPLPSSSSASPSSGASFPQQQQQQQGLVCRRSVGMDSLAPVLQKLFDAEKIFDRFPVSTDVQFQSPMASMLFSSSSHASPPPSSFHQNQLSQCPTSGWSDYNNRSDDEVLTDHHRCNAPSAWRASCSNSQTVATGLYGNTVLFWKDPVRDVGGEMGDNENLFWYTFDGENSDVTKQRPSKQWNPTNAEDPADEKTRVTHISMNSREVAFATPSRIVRLNRRQ